MNYTVIINHLILIIVKNQVQLYNKQLVINHSSVFCYSAIIIEFNYKFTIYYWWLL